ncbi:MAG: hypothetical protein PF638_02315, partial [Candidatus Delongbacteria bacterium]|nr:hypothetical protein [Candidatus Delongbacteria bacterium]
MKYFTILILILILSFFYVALVETDDSDIEIQRIQLVSNIDTSYIAEIPNNSFLKKIDIDLSGYKTTKKTLIYDSLEYVADVIEFEDSLVIELPKENKKSDLFAEFYSFSTVKNIFRKHRTHLGKSKSEIIIHRVKDSYIYDLRILRSVRRRWDRKKKKSIVVFDIAGLRDSLINDTTKFPFFSKIKERSKYFTRTQLLSSNRFQSKLSILKCLEPYLVLDEKAPFKKEKSKVMTDLRNSSMPEIYDNSGYNTYYYGSNIEDKKYFSKFFNNSSLFTDKTDREIRIIQKFDNEINENKDAENFYYVDLNTDVIDSDYYLRSVDSYLKELFFHIKSKVDMNDYIFVILSTSNKNIFDPMLTMFFSEKSIDMKEIDTKVDLTDISKTILSYSKLKIPYYFSGNNLAKEKEIEDRSSILGSDTDTLMFYNENILFKKQKYSDKYELITVKENEDSGRKKEDVAFEYEQQIIDQYSGDYIKYLIFKNESNQPINYNLKINSKNRFIKLDDVGNYYSKKRTYRRY